VDGGKEGGGKEGGGVEGGVHGGRDGGVEGGGVYGGVDGGADGGGMKGEGGGGSSLINKEMSVSSTISVSIFVTFSSSSNIMEVVRFTRFENCMFVASVN
jgi:hypothetical protein